MTAARRLVRRQEKRARAIERNPGLAARLVDGVRTGRLQGMSRALAREVLQTMTCTRREAVELAKIAGVGSWGEGAAVRLAQSAGIEVTP